ncbi:uncharacterized protein V6R79_020055 [Siganus canaliculatus]
METARKLPFPTKAHLIISQICSVQQHALAAVRCRRSVLECDKRPGPIEDGAEGRTERCRTERCRTERCRTEHCSGAAWRGSGVAWPEHESPCAAKQQTSV